jgi:hypothetical protein
VVCQQPLQLESTMTPMFQHADTRHVSPEAGRVSFSIFEHAIGCVHAGMVWQFECVLALRR